MNLFIQPHIKMAMSSKWVCDLMTPIYSNWRRCTSPTLIHMYMQVASFINVRVLKPKSVLKKYGNKIKLRKPCRLILLKTDTYTILHTIACIEISEVVKGEIVCIRHYATYYWRELFVLSYLFTKIVVCKNTYTIIFKKAQILQWVMRNTKKL